MSSSASPSPAAAFRPRGPRARQACPRQSRLTACSVTTRVCWSATAEADGDTLFPFGHGLGFSSWEYESLDAPPRAAPGAAVRVTVELRNTGGRRSREVVQLYASRSESGIERPVRWLVGFAAVIARPRRARHRDDHRPAAGVRALERRARSLGARARHVRSGRRLILGGAADVDADHGGVMGAGPSENGALVVAKRGHLPGVHPQLRRRRRRRHRRHRRAALAAALPGRARHRRASGSTPGIRRR